MMDELEGTPVSSTPETQGTDWLYRIVFAGLMAMAIGVMFIGLTASSGCVTMAKDIIIPTPEPTPTIPPTEIPTPTPTPTPEPTPDYTGCGWQDNCYKLRDWHTWFRVNVTGINIERGSRDLTTHATVYAYKLFPSIHYHDPLWGSRAYFKESPEAGYVYLFVFLNIFSDTDVRQYGYKAHKFRVFIRDQTYFPEEPVQPENRIRELDDLWDMAHVQSPVPWGYKRVQDLGTGILKTEELEYIYGGRSNAWDGYLIFEIPSNTNMEELKVGASFDNLGGNAWWKLV